MKENKFRKYKTHAQDFTHGRMHTITNTNTFKRVCIYVHRNSNGSVTVWVPHRKASQASAYYGKDEKE